MHTGSPRLGQPSVHHNGHEAAAPASGWTVARFGDRAHAVRQKVVASLIEAVANAQDAQRWSRSDKRFPYGQALMTRRYEAIVEEFRDEPGVQIVKPHRSPHQLVVLDGNLLLPFRYAEDDTTSILESRISDGRISVLVRELFERFGPASSYRQEELDLSLGEPGAAEPAADAHRLVLDHLPDDTRLVPIAYAGNAHAGLLRLYWGEAELVDDYGRLRWLHHEQIPLTGAQPLAEGGAVHAEAPFGQGVLPGLGISARPAIERANAALFPVQSETAPQEDQVSASDA
ncbi:hypothetical protein Pth03_52820 [Planotetraspora thailandica]|uniref:Uncharacterized protein n=1 Tax=Planotetraspora thailandica TaxID=487172 RepID=A0A8J3V3T3_9ACTN|nr:hypothetical protein [Planotetraspora thailandica]GII56893.1 hypothetical protein Pth03_52820 [Planotetraspora thailandica]